MGNNEQALTEDSRSFYKKKILKRTTKVKQLEEDHLMMIRTPQMKKMKDKEEEDHLEGDHLHPETELTIPFHPSSLIVTSGHQGPGTTMAGPTLTTGYSSWDSISIL